jgi:hypothetical protein
MAGIECTALVVVKVDGAGPAARLNLVQSRRLVALVYQPVMVP